MHVPVLSFSAHGKRAYNKYGYNCNNNQADYGNNANHVQAKSNANQQAKYKKSGHRKNDARKESDSISRGGAHARSRTTVALGGGGAIHLATKEAHTALS